MQTITQVANTMSSLLGADVVYWDTTKEYSEPLGITDDRDEAYGYIKLRNTNQKEFSLTKNTDFGCSGHLVLANYKMIIDTRCTSAESVLNAMVQALSSIPLVEITAGSVNQELIYREETGKELRECDKKLACVEFSHQTIISECCNSVDICLC
jgi:hypothetical protein